MRSFLTVFFFGDSMCARDGSWKKCWQFIQRQPVTSFFSGVIILLALHLAQYLRLLNLLTQVPVGSFYLSQGCWMKRNAARSNANHSNNAPMFNSANGSAVFMCGTRLFWQNRTSAGGDDANSINTAGIHHFFRNSLISILKTLT